jgi:glycosyltransferase involved in cell wall biosynthesis
MRIAQVSPLIESVPPKTYGGTERVVGYLTEELVRGNHDVTLFASGDSETGARLVPCSPHSLRLDPDCVDPHAWHVLLVERVFEHAGEFDLVHFHVDYLHFPLSRRFAVPQLTTLHGRLDAPELQPLYREYSDMPLVSISNAQREPLAFANWVATIYHGMPSALSRPRFEAGRYFAFVGRFAPEKRPDLAIEIARRAGIPLKMAAKVDPVDEEYFHDVVEPLLREPGVEYVGEVDEAERSDFLAEAIALLFPIDWPEPFGLVMIEAMACGTPVLAFRRGSVPEVVEDGVTGYVVDDVDGAVEAAARIGAIDRAGCRRRFEERFSVERMTRDYVELYRRLIAGGNVPRVA